MSENKKSRTIAGLAVAGALAVGGAYTAINAYADNSTPSATPSASQSANQGQQGERQQGQQAHQHTAATADETAKVTAAVKAKDPGASVTKVEKDADGSFDVTATKDGQQVRYEVSADYKTVTEGRGPGGGHMQGTEVTGAELTKVTNAVKAKDSAFTVEKVFKSTDGTYHVMGTKSGNRAGYEVSADLKTITAHTMGDKGGRGGHMQGTEVTGAELTKVTNAVKAKDSAFTVEKVFKSTDGTYHVMGTKSGNRAGYEVSADLKTITAHTMRGKGNR